MFRVDASERIAANPNLVTQHTDDRQGRIASSVQLNIGVQLRRQNRCAVPGAPAHRVQRR